MAKRGKNKLMKVSGTLIKPLKVSIALLCLCCCYIEPPPLIFGNKDSAIIITITQASKLSYTHLTQTMGRLRAWEAIMRGKCTAVYFFKLGGLGPSRNTKWRP